MDRESNRTVLYFAFINTITGNLNTNGSIPAVDMVLDQINNRSDILEDYILSYTNVLDSGVCNYICLCSCILICNIAFL